jgi:hypothetical protein
MGRAMALLLTVAAPSVPLFVSSLDMLKHARPGGASSRKHPMPTMSAENAARLGGGHELWRAWTGRLKFMSAKSETTTICPRCKGAGDRPDKTCWLCEPRITTRKQRQKMRLEAEAVDHGK